MKKNSNKKTETGFNVIDTDGSIHIKEAYSLCHTLCGSFYHEHKDNFDYVRGNPTEDESSTMLFYDRQLEALLSEKPFKKAGHKVARAGHWNEIILDNKPKMEYEHILIINVHYEDSLFEELRE